MQNKTIQWLKPVTTLVATVSHDFVRRLPGAHAPHGTNAKNRTRDRRLGVVWIIRNRWIEALLLTSSESLGVTVTVESKQLWKNRESHSEMCICGLNSAVTKHSDNFVWKDTSECVTRRCDDTSWQDASELLSIKTPLFWGRSATKKLQTKPGNALSDALLMSRFQNFGWRRKKKSRSARF